MESTESNVPAESVAPDSSILPPEKHLVASSSEASINSVESPRASQRSPAPTFSINVNNLPLSPSAGETKEPFSPLEASGTLDLSMNEPSIKFQAGKGFNADYEPSMTSANTITGTAKSVSSSGGKSYSPNSPNITQRFPPFPEKNTYDNFLCQLTDNGYDWQCFRFDHRVKILTYLLEKVVVDKELAAYSVSIDVRAPEQFSKDKKSKAITPSMLLKSLGSSNASKTKKRSNSRVTANVIASLVFYNADGKKLQDLNLDKVKQIIGSNEPEGKEELLYPLVLETQDSVWSLYFGSYRTRDLFDKALKAVAAVVLPETEFGSTCRFELGNPKMGLVYSCLCYHQGEAAQGVLMEDQFDINQCIYEFNTESVHLLLMNNKLLEFHANSGVPSKVYDLSDALVTEVSVASHLRLRKTPDLAAAFQLTVYSGKGKGKHVFKVNSQLERDRWMEAFVLAQNDPHRSRRASDVVIVGDSPSASSSSKIQTLLEQKVFFEFVRYCVHPINLICTTEIAKPEEWTAQMGAVPKDKRGKLKSVENMFVNYHSLLDRVWVLLKDCLLICEDGPNNTGDENIGFSYPGFENEMFRVATLSILRAWRLFRASGKNMSFSLSGWDGTLGARSIGKELMQTLPDVQELYEQGEVQKAKDITYEAALEELHHLTLCQYLKANRSDFFTGRQYRFSWQQVMASKQRGDDTRHVLDSKAANKYVFNPPIELLQDFIRGRNEHFSSTVIAMFTQLNFLEALRLIHQERLRCLQNLNAALSLWFETNGMQMSKNLLFYTKLQADCQEEIKTMKILLDRLPAHAKLIEHYNIFVSN
jgi:hypothetical protein